MANKSNNSFYDFAEAFIRKSERTKSSLTVASYRQTFQKLKEYQPVLAFDDITASFYDGFISYLSCSGITRNTCGKYIKVLKTILNDATSMGINKNFAFQGFKAFKEEIENVVLSEDEIQRLRLSRDSLSDAKRRILDIFLVICYTGLKLSEVATINMKDILVEEKKEPILVLKRAGGVIHVPTDLFVVSVLDEYGGRLPEPISVQKINKALKEICRKAGIMDETCAAVSLETARRSFAYNAFLNDISISAIMTITGHKELRDFQNFAGIKHITKHLQAGNHPFLNL